MLELPIEPITYAKCVVTNGSEKNIFLLIISFDIFSHYFSIFVFLIFNLINKEIAPA